MNIVHSFQELVVRGDHQGTIELLKNFEQSRKLSVHERGWVYWNISDGYALLREPEPLYANHREFFEWGRKTSPRSSYTGSFRIRHKRCHYLWGTTLIIGWIGTSMLVIMPRSWIPTEVFGSRVIGLWVVRFGFWRDTVKWTVCLKI